MARNRALFRVCLFATSVVGVLTSRSVADGGWLRYGHDAALTGRSRLKGNIAKPRVAWSCSVAGRELVIDLVPEQGKHPIHIPGEAAIPERLEATEPKETFHERWADVLPDVPGKERVAWSHTWTTEKVCRLQCFAYDQGKDKPRLVWASDPPEDTIFSPLNIVNDIDGDGVQEILVAAHYRAMIFEATTGRKETELRYHSSRPYGWFGLADVDADDAVELVTIGDFQSHIDVLEYDPTKDESDRLSVKWRRDIEQDIAQRRKWPQIGPGPLTDVTGDGRPEIILNLYNDTGDGQWHTVVLDAANGKCLYDFAQRYLHGAAQVNGKGGAELFLAASDGVYAPTFGRIELVSVGAPGTRVVWSQDRAGWCTHNLPQLGANWSTSASDGMRHVVADSQERSFQIYKPVDTQDTSVRSRAMQIITMSCGKDGTFSALRRVEGLIGEVEVLPEKRRVRTQLPAHTQARLVGFGIRPVVVRSEPLGVRVSSPVVARLQARARAVVIVEGAARNVLAIEPPSKAQGEPKLRWQRPGRGMADGSRVVGPLAVDLDGDGGCEVVVADRAPGGHAVLIAYKHDGTPLWERAFPRTPGQTPVWNAGALTFWWPGRFFRPDRTDLFVNTRRGPMHSDIGHLLNGKDGSIMWTKSKATLEGQFSWGYAGIPLAIADVDGDRLDELASLYPVCFWLADGRTGEITAGKELASRKMLPAWAAYGEPIVHDFTGDGVPDVLLDSAYILALLDLKGNVIWHGTGRDAYPTSADAGNVGETTSVKHALIDFDADGVCEIASAGYGDGVRAIDPRNGKVLWACASPKPTCPKVTAANIDGKAGDELLYAAGDTLVAITGSRQAGGILWTWRASAKLSLPAIADTDADGLAEIVVQAADGTVCCLDAATERQ